ncbi:unnamed protein product [Paramecium pentaurelia]|uniref:Uncharacterized protein n=1 Tax=Paramecium pentaurelia TaxID=43138 RepID=A0A8S1YGX3_9CILI|nr:unnamed protein product [Paramecium pentaurelia]
MKNKKKFPKSAYQRERLKSLQKKWSQKHSNIYAPQNEREQELRIPLIQVLFNMPLLNQSLQNLVKSQLLSLSCRLAIDQVLLRIQKILITHFKSRYQTRKYYIIKIIQMNLKDQLLSPGYIKLINLDYIHLFNHQTVSEDHPIKENNYGNKDDQKVYFIYQSI